MIETTVNRAGSEEEFNLRWREISRALEPHHRSPYVNNPARLAADLLGLRLTASEHLAFDAAWRMPLGEAAIAVMSSPWRWALACLALAFEGEPSVAGLIARLQEARVPNQTEH